MNTNEIDHTDDSRKIYYVNVQSRQLYEQPDIAPYHLVIIANASERDGVIEQFHKVENSDEGTLETIFQWYSNNYDMSIVNDEHGDRLQRLYEELYRLGTDETRRHIEQMKIL
ncbi:MAG TPA: hypothetical protein IAA29_10835 [Candidatus Paenibacillus intestinavium]|nr:hypothetical protein [Candidatus Paenibacillus intestinavium]